MFNRNILSIPESAALLTVFFRSDNFSYRWSKPLHFTSRAVIVCLGFILLYSSCIHADTGSVKSLMGKKRPTIALVLAGGGAKGAAHVGVLKVLEEMRIPVDIITGTSMGAYIGGLYASGKTAEQIEQNISSMDWNSGYRDSVNRVQRHVREKEFKDQYRLDADLGFRLDTLDIRVPKGMIQGQNMLRIIRQAAGNISRLDSFDLLPIRYRAVATDIATLKPVVLDHGYLVDAFMASMSVPGVLPPYEVEGQLLVDGGVTNNMPVDVAKSLGADIVIAVDISTDYKDVEQFTTIITVADQLTNYLVRQSSQKQAQELEDNDIYLKPDVGNMETVEFKRIGEAYQKGYAAAQQVAAKLKRLSLPAGEYQSYREYITQQTLPYIKNNQLTLSRIELVNKTHYSDKVLLAMLDIPLSQPVSSSLIERNIRQLYALDRFELIHYDIEQDVSGQKLIVQVREKSWGPNYLTFRLALEDDFNNQSRYSVGVANDFTNLDDLGSEFRVKMEMGTDRRISVEYFHPISNDRTVFSTTSVTYQNEQRKFSDEDMEEVGISASENYFPVSYVELVGELALGYQYNPWDEFKLGLRATDGEASLSTLPSWGDMAYQRKGVFARYRFDSLDNHQFPGHGVYLDIDYMRSKDTATSVQNSVSEKTSGWGYEYSASVIAARSYLRHTLVGRAEYAGVCGSQDFTYPIHPLSIGGFLNLSGIPSNSLNGLNKAYTSLIYRYRWFDNDFGLFTSPVYLGGAYEYGGVWSKSNQTPLFQAGVVFIGIDSPVGPVMFGYGRTENNYGSVYLAVGASFK